MKEIPDLPILPSTKNNKCFPVLHIAAWEKNHMLWSVYDYFPLTEIDRKKAQFKST